MRTIASAVICALAVVPLLVSAGGQKELQNVQGSVSYQHGGKAARPLAQSASTALADNDYAITGSDSIGAVVLPDSSRVTMGSDTRVQMAFFNQAQIANAKFVVYNGKTRFKVEHPGGKPANYTFVTPTASIAVRGTEGDIGVDGKNLVVNVYGLSNPNLPVVVTTQDGKQFVLKAGQQLLANWVKGAIQTKVQTLTEQAVAQFQQLGAPISNWAAAAANLPQNAIASVASRIPGAGLLSAFGGSRNSGGSADSSPAPSPTPCATAAPPSGGGVMGFLRRAVSSSSSQCASPSPSPSPSPTP